MFKNFTKNASNFMMQNGKYILLGLTGLASIAIGWFEKQEQESYMQEQMESMRDELRNELMAGNDPDESEEPEENEDDDSEEESDSEES